MLNKSEFMACSPDFVQYIIDQCSGAGEIAVKKMMGDYCVYCDGVLFGLICDNGNRARKSSTEGSHPPVTIRGCQGLFLYR